MNMTSNVKFICMAVAGCFALHGEAQEVWSVDRCMAYAVGHNHTVKQRLLEAKNYEHALLSSLTGLAARLDALSIQAVVPAPVAIDHTPLFEVFLLKEGRVVPLRSLFAALEERREAAAERA